MRDNRTEFGVLLKLVTLIKMCLNEKATLQSAYADSCELNCVLGTIRNRQMLLHLPVKTLHCGIGRVQGKLMELNLNGKH